MIKTTLTPFDFVNSVTFTKKDFFKDDPLAKKFYVPYVINRALSYFADTVLYANEMNRHAQLPQEVQFQYYLNSIRPARRFSKWSKQEQSDELNAVQQFFQYNTEKAKQALKVLVPEQVKTIKAKIAARGETNDSSRKHG